MMQISVRKQLDVLIERVKGHPALEAYHILDEPGAAAFPALGRLVAYLKERDPKHLAYINLLPTYANEQQLGVTAADAQRGRIGSPKGLSGVEAGIKWFWPTVNTSSNISKSSSRTFSVMITIISLRKRMDFSTFSIWL